MWRPLQVEGQPVRDSGRGSLGGRRNCASRVHPGKAWEVEGRRGPDHDGVAAPRQGFGGAQ